MATPIIPGNIYQKGRAWFCRGADSDSVDLSQFATEIEGKFCFLTMEITHASQQNFTLWGHRTEEDCKETFHTLFGRITDDVKRSGANLPYSIKRVPTTVATSGRDGDGFATRNADSREGIYSIIIFPATNSLLGGRLGIKGILFEFLNDETQKACLEVLASGTKATETGKLPEFLRPYAPTLPSGKAAPLNFLERV